MTAPNPEAVFDCLCICCELEPLAGGAAESEIMSLSYLGCLLGVYNGLPPSEWGYGFAATKSSAPFSPSLDEAIEDLRNSGLTMEGPDGLRLTQAGADELAGLSELARFKLRREYIIASCRSASAIPLPLVTESVTAEPQLRQALRLASSRPLLDEVGRHSLISHFEALAQAVPDADDLFVPAVVWLSYLGQHLYSDSDEAVTSASVEEN